MFLRILHSTLASTWLALSFSSGRTCAVHRVEQVEQGKSNKNTFISRCFFCNLSTSDANVLRISISNKLKQVPQKYEIFLIKLPVHIFRHKKKRAILSVLSEGKISPSGSQCIYLVCKANNRTVNAK